VRSTGQTGAFDVHILYKSYLTYPDSDLDVLYMNLDLLDETYPMVKSKLYFVVFDHTGLTGGTHRSDRSHTRRANFVCEQYVCVLTNYLLAALTNYRSESQRPDSRRIWQEADRSSFPVSRYSYAQDSE
jgi:hypothetical protein